MKRTNSCFIVACLAAAVIAGLELGCGNDPATPSMVPADYRSLFTEVRGCRPTVEHAAVGLDGTAIEYIRVLASSAEAAQLYTEDANPLPVGTVIVKEGYIGTDCDSDGTLVVITAMRKEAAGFDPEDGDWLWHTVTPDLRLVDDSKVTCITCHAEEVCRVRDYMCTLP